MAIQKFDPKELELKDVSAFGRTMKDFAYPISKREAVEAAFARKPWWQVTQAVDARMFSPEIIPDNIARALVWEAAGENGPRKFADHDINKDMFGVEWEYIAQVGGSMVRPGKPFMEDIEEWYDTIVWPDIDSWDWKGSAERNNQSFLTKDTLNQMWFQTGYFERLIALLEFENALMAVFDEDSKEHVHKFFDKLTELYISIFDKAKQTFPELNAVFFHDDWGSQKAPFFSPAVCEEMIVPYMKRLTDFLHGIGIYCEIHSCGNNYQQIPNYIKAGWDAWAPQLMNDSYQIYDDYGDKLLIATFPQEMPTAEELGKLPEEEIRKYARAHADRVCRPEKSSFYNFYASDYLQIPAFKEELYIRSRENYSK